MGYGGLCRHHVFSENGVHSFRKFDGLLKWVSQKNTENRNLIYGMGQNLG